MKRLFLALCVLGLLCGCGRKKEDSLAKKTGNKVGEVLTDFTTGIGKGIDNQMLVDIELSDGVSEKGFTKTIAKINGFDVDKTVSVYLIATNAFSGKLMMKAIDAHNREIGRSVEQVEFEEDDAKYITFKFEKETDIQLVRKFTLFIK